MTLQNFQVHTRISRRLYSAYYIFIIAHNRIGNLWRCALRHAVHPGIIERCFCVVCLLSICCNKFLKNDAWKIKYSFVKFVTFATTTKKETKYDVATVIFMGFVCIYVCKGCFFLHVVFKKALNAYNSMLWLQNFIKLKTCHNFFQKWFEQVTATTGSNKFQLRGTIFSHLFPVVGAAW